ncbi:TonB-dependent receptor [Colwellia sp. MB02u-10]|uniref:TonB-dependent receptor n=1 Tax=Colwellia sp. MB02u-10 TaxID=2759828 RepID=UPI0015F6242A|nr:TonB-dependent receptor [Colwellia sp. MB02u-10]MBA6340332.1 TonB-dependent receptor [Colwellia sp. MB02u-10]
MARLITLTILLFALPVLADDIEKISVIGQTPLSSKMSADKNIIGSAQYVSVKDITRAQATSLADHMRNQLVSVNISDVQNNPFQPDVQYRGFTASPLLGLPQGISVYLNGVRFNEPFGDTVNWDLIPLAALDSVALFSGSNPVFGQNTLGGALALKTKNGFSYTENETDVRFGSFGQQQYTVQSGGNNGNWGYYFIANRYTEDGWRDFSQSELKQALASFSFQDNNNYFELLLSANDNEMTGNGAAPEELIAIEGRETVYTHPDKTNNDYKTISISSDSTINEQLSLQANAYYRQNKINSINGDDSDYDGCDFGAGETLCEEDEEDGSLTMVDFVGYDEGTLFSDIATIDPDEVDGTLNDGDTKNTSYGFASQLVHITSFDNHEQEIIVGLGMDKADINFKSNTQFGILNNDFSDDDRSVSATGFFDSESQVRLDVTTEQQYIFASYSMVFNQRLTLNVAGRYNNSHIIMNDLIDDGEGSLDGDHKFHRFNPAVGLNYQLNKEFTAKLSYSESSRVPSPAELSCADEDDPCKLPNGFVADPPLEQVIAKTLEASLQYNADSVSAIATLFSTKTIDDIIFQQAGSTSSEGYFVNIDKIQRQGVELAYSVAFTEVTVGTSYNYLKATFESPFISFSPVNPRGANRQVSPGDIIPGQPQHQLKLHADWQINENISLGTELLYASDSYYRGDEANENKMISAYSLINIYSSYQMTKRLRLSAKVDNLFDHQYDTFGTYGEADEVLADFYPDIESPYFVGPARPRSYSVNVNYKF